MKINLRTILLTLSVGSIIAAIIFIAGMYIFGSAQESAYQPASIAEKYVQSGDIIFQTSTSRQSQAIQLATHSKYSHMGIIYENEGSFYVYEAIQPVQLTPLNEWIERGESNHFVVKRLKNSENVLTDATLHKMKSIGEKYKGKNYDLYFEWTDDRIYCSELVWKIYKEATGLEIGHLENLSDFDLSNEVVKSKMAERYGDKIPYNEKVISPVAMFNADELELIIEN